MAEEEEKKEEEGAPAEGGEAELTEEELEEQAAAAKKKKMIMIVAIVLVLAIVGVVLKLFVFKGPDPEVEAEKLKEGLEGVEKQFDANKESEELAGHDAEGGHNLFFVNIPEITSSIRSHNGKSRVLKATVVLEVNGGAEDHAFIEETLPRVVNECTTLLREMYVEELQGAQGLMRVREELLRRIRVILSPMDVRNVLFKQILLQ